MQFNRGFGAQKELVWDTTWNEEAKRTNLAKLDGSARAELLRQMYGKRNQAGVDADLGMVHDDTLGNLDRWSRGDLHSLRGLFDQQKQADQLALVEKAMRDAVRQVDTGGSPPQKKTPAGRTRVINMNYVYSPVNPTETIEYAHAKFFADVARELGLELHVLTNNEGREFLSTTQGLLDGVNVKWTLVSERMISTWAEDSVEFLQSGRVAVHDSFTSGALTRGMVNGRRERWAPLLTPEFKDEPFNQMTSKEWVPEGLLVNAGKTGILREAALTEPPAHIRFYAEGGNLIVGEDTTDRTVVLVGRDTIAATMSEYSFAGEDDVRALIAEDFGLQPGQVIFVEQPGKFHLDMGLLFLGHGLAVVNTSRGDLEQAVVAAQQSPSVEARKAVAVLQLRCGLEDRAVADLEAADIKVIRQKLEDGTNYNFFNGEFVADQKGEIHYLTNGTTDKAAAGRFSELLKASSMPIVKVHFSPSFHAKESLKSQGGVGCRIKGAPLL